MGIPVHCLQAQWPKQRNKLSSKKSNQEIKSQASTTLKLWKFSSQRISSLFFSHKNLKFKVDLSTNKNLKQWSFNIQWNTLLIRSFIWAFRSIRSILVYSVEKSKDCNRRGEVLWTSDLERFSCFITSTTPVKVLRIQLTQGTSAFLSFDTQRSLTIRKIAL